ncbi:unnamed protein product [Sphagnum balticum]
MTMRFFIHSCSSCCSITTPRRPAGSYQALITLWLPCFCGRGIILSTLLQANAAELKVLKLQKGQQLQVKVKNILSGVGDVCECFWMMPSKCFGRVQRLLLWDVSMLLPRKSHPQLYQNALATSVEASSSGNPTFSINNCLDVLAEVEVASTRKLSKCCCWVVVEGSGGFAVLLLQAEFVSVRAV